MKSLARSLRMTQQGDSPRPDRESGPGDPDVNQTPQVRRLDPRTLALWIIAGGMMVALLHYMQDVFIPFVLSGLLFYTLDPFVDRLERARMPRALAAALVLIVALSSVAGLAYSLSDDAMAVVNNLPVAAKKLRTSLQSWHSNEPGALDKVQRAAEEVKKAASETVGQTNPPNGVVRVQVDEPAFRASDFLLTGSWNALSLMGSAAIVIFLTFFLLVSDDLFKRKLVEIAGPTLSHKKLTVEVLDEIATHIERFLLLQIVTSIGVALCTGLALSLIGVEDAAFWGLIAGVFNSVPYLGPVVVSGGLSVVAFLQFGTIYMAAMTAFVALAITSIEGLLVTPMLMSRAGQMNQVAIFFGLLFWTWVWGVWGVLLAVPMMMVIKTVCDRVDGLKPIATIIGE
jgi:predicted PurR-regulated permease PerM